MESFTLGLQESFVNNFEKCMREYTTSLFGDLHPMEFTSYNVVVKQKPLCGSLVSTKTEHQKC